MLAMCAWVKQQIKKIEEQAQAEADVTFPDEKTAGSVKDAKGDDKVVSYTSRVQRKPEILGRKDFAFIEWVSKHYPTEIEWAVRPAFLTELRDRALDKDGIILGPHGEVCEVAGLDDPVVYTMTKLQKGADKLLEPLLSKVPLADLPDLIAGESA